MRGQVEAATADLVERLRGVGSKADELLDKQEEMDGALRDDVGGRVDEVHAGVAALQGQVAYSNQTITLLCGALAEVAKRVGLSNGRYVRALDGLVHGAPSGGSQPWLPGGRRPCGRDAAGARARLAWGRGVDLMDVTGRVCRCWCRAWQL